MLTLEGKWNFTSAKDVLMCIRQRTVLGGLVTNQQNLGDLGEVTHVHGNCNMMHATL